MWIVKSKAFYSLLAFYCLKLFLPQDSYGETWIVKSKAFFSLLVSFLLKLFPQQKSCSEMWIVKPIFFSLSFFLSETLSSTRILHRNVNCEIKRTWFFLSLSSFLSETLSPTRIMQRNANCEIKSFFCLLVSFSLKLTLPKNLAAKCELWNQKLFFSLSIFFLKTFFFKRILQRNEKWWNRKRTFFPLCSLCLKVLFFATKIEQRNVNCEVKSFFHLDSSSWILFLLWNGETVKWWNTNTFFT